MTERVIELVVSRKQVGERLDKFLAENVSDLSRARAKQLINSGRVLVAGKQARPDYKIREAEIVVVRVPPREKFELILEKIPLRIIYEDQDCLVVDKPVGLVVHPAAGHLRGTLVNAILDHLSGLIPSKTIRPGIVHRLDKDTSGLMVVAKNERAQDYLKNQFKNREVTKKYLALVQGRIKDDFGVVEAPIGRHPINRRKFTVDPQGKEAITEFKVIKRFEDFTLLEVQPKTGRTHQIRVHFSYLKHPLVGDSLYGGKKLLPRQFLHAFVLGLKLPLSGEYVEFKSNLPEDLKEFLSRLD